MRFLLLPSVALALSSTTQLRPQALKPPEHVPPPAGDLVLIDGDNVRGKTAFAISAEGLVAQAEAYSRTKDAVLYIDHGLTSEALGASDALRVVFAGPSQSADDCIARDATRGVKASARAEGSAPPRQRAMARRGSRSEGTT